MIAYFDCFSGAAGDMILGSMIDAGMPISYLKRELKKLPLHGYKITTKIERRGALGGVNLTVAINEKEPRKHSHRHHHASLSVITKMISSSRLSPRVKKMSIEIFETLGRAEAHVHRTKLEDVHFHEVGAIDSIVDIVGSAIGFDYFNFDAVYASPLPVARGWINCQHGRIPLPAPAALEILKGVPLVKSPVKAELVTPTGAAILKTVAKFFGENPLRVVESIGFGHGDRNFKEMPNSLRLLIGEGERLLAVEANIDDMNPQIYEYLIERLLESGAIDVTVAPVLMKKRRPAQRLHVLCNESELEQICRVMIEETTTLGVRYYPVERKMLTRKIETVATKFGKVRVKTGMLGEKIFNVAPEYEDCKKIARSKKIPLKAVIAEVQKKF